MLALISPAKKMNFKPNDNLDEFTQPQFLSDIEELTKRLKTLSSQDLQNLMKISENLGQLNYDRYQRFETPFTRENSGAAILSFRGDTYVGLDADTLSPDNIKFAQNHLGILSGLYGLLRPCDLIQPYRLEMGTKLSSNRGEDLYDFWGDLITQACIDMVKNHKNKSVISLASNEYIKAVKPKKLDGAFITCHFKEMKNGAPKTIGLFAKRARGMMARFMIENKIETPSGLKEFQEDGYAFLDTFSDEKNYVFLRDQN